MPATDSGGLHQQQPPTLAGTTSSKCQGWPKLNKSLKPLDFLPRQALLSMRCNQN